MQTKPVEAIDVMAHRGLWTLPVTLFIILCFRRLRETLALISSVRFLGWVALAAFMLTINWGVYVFAVTNERATEASLGYFMLPLLTIALGVFVFGEKPKPVQIIAICHCMAVIDQWCGLGCSWNSSRSLSVVQWRIHGNPSTDLRGCCQIVIAFNHWALDLRGSDLTVIGGHFYFKGARKSNHGTYLWIGVAGCHCGQC